MSQHPSPCPYPMHSCICEPYGKIAALEGAARAAAADAEETRRQYSELVALIENRRPEEPLHYDHTVVVRDLQRLIEREHRYGRALSDMVHPPETVPGITDAALLREHQRLAEEALGLKTYRTEDEQGES